MPTSVAIARMREGDLTQADTVPDLQNDTMQPQTSSWRFAVFQDGVRKACRTFANIQPIVLQMDPRPDLQIQVQVLA